jgi:hypothetical protein
MEVEFAISRNRAGYVVFLLMYTFHDNQLVARAQYI